MLDIQVLLEKINSSFDGTLRLSADNQAMYAGKENIIKLLEMLKEQFGYKMLVDISAVELESSFEVVYHLMKLNEPELLRVKVSLPLDSPVLPSIVSLWKAADVQEREEFDLMGIIFEGHGNLSRILCSDDMVGHPLRKNFKLKIVDRFKGV